jgi:acyl-CoA thioesterase-1
MSIMPRSSIPLPKFLQRLLVATLATLAIAHTAAADQSVKILALGDSLTAGYGLTQGQGFTDQLQAAFAKMGRPVTVINGGVSGDTSAGGLARTDWALGDKPQVVILELGANDMLRGIEPESTKANLAGIIEKATAAGAKVLLCGMKAQRNLGADYVARFDAIYPDLAKQENVPLYPFFMDGIIHPDASADRQLLQADGMHPTAAGAALIVQRMMPTLLALLGTHG